MRRCWKWHYVLLGLLPMVVHAISVDKLSGEAYTDMGQLVRGNTEGLAVDGHYLNRFGVTLYAADTVQEKLFLKVGVGGLFWRTFPPEKEFWKNSIHFGPGITEASATFSFTRQLNAQGGYFPFRYSPSMNLGEYLLRSESYPTYVATGGWTWVDSAYMRSLGFRVRASHFGGRFSHELGLYWEYENPPLYDISPAYLFSLRPSKGVEIGGGVALRRWFMNSQENPSMGSDPFYGDQYVEISNFPAVQGRSDQQASATGERKGIRQFLMNLQGCNADQSKCTHYLDTAGNLVDVDTNGLAVPGSQRAAIFTKTEDITRRAVNVMARVTFDCAELFHLNGTGPFKAYAEWAILGVQNQPVYYEDITQRMPVMVGVHIPTFGLLDLLAVEAEYLNNPYPDSKQKLDGGTNPQVYPSDMPIPDVDYSKNDFTVPSVHGDDWKWSVHAVRSIVPGLKIKLQAANDHMRLRTVGDYGHLPAAQPQTAGKNQWYYLVHLQWGF
ncbi:MAG TPA: hypothetical protein DCQ83_05550 [Fibrobacteres bacterium]|jgi:hypothetical protein|nr:hypothetical protein [Fibrobacterota bacterium]